jgi:hypothetical protein
MKKMEEVCRHDPYETRSGGDGDGKNSCKGLFD